MFNLWKTLFGGENKKKKTDSELFLEFMRVQKDKMNSETEKAMLRYLEEIYKKAVSSQKKIEKKNLKISSWISNDLAIDQEKIRKKQEEENRLPHPMEQFTRSS